MRVHKAVVLAAGHGTRLRPFTCATPKPLLPVWGEPMLGRIISLLRERGVDDIVVNSHHLAEQIRAWTDAWRRAAASNRLRSYTAIAIAGSGFSVKGALLAGMGSIAVINDHVAYQDFGGADEVVDALDASVADIVFRALKV